MEVDIMDDLGISNIAMNMSAIRLQSEVSMRVMKMTMDTTEMLNDEMLDILASLTGSGQNIDVSA